MPLWQVKSELINSLIPERNFEFRMVEETGEWWWKVRTKVRTVRKTTSVIKIVRNVVLSINHGKFVDGNV